ncbi:MAG: 30S ribosomal protein S12 methylthiotransferase RimO [Deltaproteobacteria bacterium]|nr:30S ribosomal protein S12 methylthiotransferase RimO [Deltaproteobacteria bacterium]
MQESLTETLRQVHLISLGCARNKVDSEVMLGTLLGEGWRHTDEPEQADAIVINTCGFIDAAKEESIDTILNAAALKKSRPGLRLVVTGCLTQRYRKQLADGLPEVDFFVGTDEFTKIAELLKSPPPQGTVLAKRTNYLYTDAMPRVNTLPGYAAYVKVAEGCQHHCSFCIIPAIRGRLRSRPIDSIVREVGDLCRQGVREINLIAQDLAAYGRDQGSDQLLPLLRELVKTDISWIRLLYIYPENISDEFLEFFASEDKLVKYLDIPVQHASDRILQKMNRGITQKELRESIRKVRSYVPDVAIRTSVMVGFPGETEEDFEELKTFVRETEFSHLGCFTYSQEEGTVAARLPGQIPEEIRQQRQQQIMELQREISAECLRRMVGKTMPVLVSGASSETELLWEGRLATQAPEVDGVVYLNEGKPVAGEIQMVRISASHDYDLIGEVLVEHSSM